MKGGGREESRGQKGVEEKITQEITMDLIHVSQLQTSQRLQSYQCGSAGKEFACNVGDLGLIPGLGRSFGEGEGYPLQYSDLENSMDCVVCGVAKSWT